MKKIYFVIILLLFGSRVYCSSGNNITIGQNDTQSDVILQGYYWNLTPGGIWWDSLSTLSTGLASSLFESIWIPSPSKGSSGKFSMGYDIYDHYDFGNYFQCGTLETRFGSLKELQKMINRYHSLNLKVYADIVLGYVTGGESIQKYECSPNGVPDSSYLVFNYLNGSNRFKKDASFFYPNAGACTDVFYKRRIKKIQNQKIEWFAFNRIFVRDSLISYGHFYQDSLNLDGFRIFEGNYLDFKFIEDWTKTFSKVETPSIIDYTGDKNVIALWLENSKFINNSNLLIPDYEIREVLSGLCNDKSGNFNVELLNESGLINKGINPKNVIHFVETSEFDKTDWENNVEEGHEGITGNKKFAYSYILFSEGKPSIFFRDYYINGYKGFIDTLITIRKKYISGKTFDKYDINAFFIRDDKKQNQTILAKDVFIAFRSQTNDGHGAYLIINDNPSHGCDIYVDTQLKLGVELSEVLNHNATAIVIKPTINSTQLRIKFSVPPGSCSLFLTDTFLQLNNPPVLENIVSLKAYTETNFLYKLLFSDSNDDILKFEIIKAPEWLALNQTGQLYGIPTVKDMGDKEVIIKLTDLYGDSVTDTFVVSVKRNSAPIFGEMTNQIASVAKRFETSLFAADYDNDSLSFCFILSPKWLKIGENTGIISGTPAIQDTGLYNVMIKVSDGKGGIDSLSFEVLVKLNAGSSINTYAKPLIDGIVEERDADWRDDWLIINDDEEDGTDDYTNSPENDIYNIFATWDSDSLYLGAEYTYNDGHSFLIYIDAGLAGGVTNFNSKSGYLGDYPFSFRFLEQNSMDYFFIQNDIELFNFFECYNQKTTSLKNKVNCIINKQRQSMELAVSWDDIYGFGAGIIPENAELKIVGVIAGEKNTGAIDIAPNNEQAAETDTLLILSTITPDLNGDGIPDPTIIISSNKLLNRDENTEDYKLAQNYPNPFNPVTSISFEIPSGGLVQLRVYDILGREVATLVNKELKAGKYSYEFNAGNLTSGTYFYRIKTKNFVDVKKMIFIK
ncbi:MAG: putative Ig domain-containing protein [bacterium]